MLVTNKMLDEIVFFRSHADDAFASALLAAIGRDGQPFDIPGMGDRNDDIFARESDLRPEFRRRRS